jgi:predicted GNAT family acetyltransferase
MIRKLKVSDQSTLLDYLNKEESLNIMILAHIYAYEFNDDIMSLYGEFDESGNYLSVLLHATDQFIFYAKNRLFNLEWLAIFEHHKFSYISGINKVIDKIVPYFREFECSISFFAEAEEMIENVEESGYAIHKITSREECEKLYYLLKTIKEFEVRTRDKQAFIDTRMKMLSSGNTYYIEEDNKYISTATVSAETDRVALVNMVGTSMEARNKGLASILLKHLMNEYIVKKQKKLCLFYDNPKAGSIYKRLGFKDLEKWVVLKRK